MYKDKFVIIYSTFPHKESAVVIAKKLLNHKKVACVNITQGNSFYLWENKINESAEVFFYAKTVYDQQQIKEIIQMIGDNHPYDCPCIIVKPIIDGYAPYLSWIESQIK